jgi:4'-phosphopantetheinyl transferase
MAAFKTGSVFLGADLEKIEERHPAWYRDYFHPSELPVPEPSAATRLWTIKEALMKALGLGLTADPLTIKAGEKIELYGKSLERYKELGSPAFTVETRPFPDGFWTALAADNRLPKR